MMTEEDKEYFRKSMDKLVKMYGLDKALIDVKNNFYSPNKPERMELYYFLVGYLEELKRDEKIAYILR